MRQEARNVALERLVARRRGDSRREPARAVAALLANGAVGLGPDRVHLAAKLEAGVRGGHPTREPEALERPVLRPAEVFAGQREVDDRARLDPLDGHVQRPPRARDIGTRIAEHVVVPAVTSRELFAVRIAHDELVHEDPLRQRMEVELEGPVFLRPFGRDDVDAAARGPSRARPFAMVNRAETPRVVRAVLLGAVRHDVRCRRQRQRQRVQRRLDQLVVALAEQRGDLTQAVLDAGRAGLALERLFEGRLRIRIAFERDLRIRAQHEGEGAHLRHLVADRDGLP